MSDKPKILSFAGSLRKDSYNKKLVQIAIKGAIDAGADVTYIDLKDYPLPIYDQDIEDSMGLPENAIKLKNLFLSHDGLLLSCPEYNSSISAVLKNTIDWISRPASPDEVYLSPFMDKPVALLSASQGALGGMRGLVHIRAIFGNIFSIVLPKQKSIPNAQKAFDEQGFLIDEKAQQDVIDIGRSLVKFIEKLKN